MSRYRRNKILIAWFVFAIIALFNSACLTKPEIIQTSTIESSNIPTPTQISSEHKQNTFTPTPVLTKTEDVPPSLSPTFTAFLTLTRTPTVTATFTPTKTPTIPTPDATLPAACGIIILGEAGTQSLGSEHEIIAQGTAILCAQVYLEENSFYHIPIPEGTLNLDDGAIGLSDDADIIFYAAGGTDIFYYLFAVNQAIGIPWTIYLHEEGDFRDPPEPTYEDCYNKVGIYASDNSPSYLCVWTGAGNISRVKVEEWNPVDNRTMAVRISFITWKPSQ